MSLLQYAIPEGYLTSDLVNNTKYKGIINAYQRNTLSVIKRGNYWYTEGCPDKIFNCVKREMKRLYPTLEYLYDLRK